MDTNLTMQHFEYLIQPTSTSFSELSSLSPTSSSTSSSSSSPSHHYMTAQSFTTYSSFLFSPRYPNTASLICVAIILAVIVVVMVLGNLLVIISLARFKHLRTVSNSLIGNLAASDFLLAITVLPFSSVNECLGRWVFGRITCNFWLMADVMYCTASIWNICVIALDRYTATLFPLWYRERRSNKQACLYVGAIWMIAVVTCAPPLFGWNDLSKNYVEQPLNSNGDDVKHISENIFQDMKVNYSFLNAGLQNITEISFARDSRGQVEHLMVNPINDSFDFTGTSLDNRTAGHIYVCLLFDTPSYVIYSACVSFYIPFLLTVLLYVQIFIVLRKRLKLIREKNSKRKAVTASGSNKSNYFASGQQCGAKSCNENNKLHNHNAEQNVKISNISKFKVETVLASSSTDDQAADDVNDEMSKPNQQQHFSQQRIQQQRPSQHHVQQQQLSQHHVQQQQPSQHHVQQQQQFHFTFLQSDAPKNEPIVAAAASTASKEQLKLSPLTGMNDVAPRGNDAREQQTFLLEAPTTENQTLNDCRLSNNNPSSTSNLSILSLNSDTNKPLDNTNNNNNNNVENNNGGYNQNTNTGDNNPTTISTLPTDNLRLPDPQNRKVGMMAWVQRRPTKLNLTGAPKIISNIKIDKRQRSDKREIRATIRMAVVIAAFCAMWIGFFTLYLIEGVCKACIVPKTVGAFVFWLGYTNSAINPILYAIFNVEFRKAFKKVLGIKDKRKRRR